MFFLQHVFYHKKKDKLIIDKNSTRTSLAGVIEIIKMLNEPLSQFICDVEKAKELSRENSQPGI